MAERRYVRLALAESAKAELGVTERQLTIAREAVDKTPPANINDRTEAEFLVLRAEQQVEFAKSKVASVRLPELWVRVITMHPDDKEANRLANRIDVLSEFYDNQLDAFSGRPQQAAPGQDQKPPTLTKLNLDDMRRISTLIADVRVELDDLRRQLVKAVLADRQTGAQAEELIGVCTSQELSLILRVARWPEMLPNVSPLQSLTPQTGGLTPSAT